MKRTLSMLIALTLALTMLFSSPVSALSETDAINAGFDVYLAWHTLNYSSYSFYANSWQSPYRVVVNRYQDDAAWNGMLAAWRVLTFDLSSELNYAEKEVAYYETFLFNILYDEKTETMGTGTLDTFAEGVDAFDEASENLSLSMWKSIIELDIGVSESTPVGDLTEENFPLLLEDIQSMGEIQEALSVLGDVAQYIGYCNTVFDLINRISKVQTLLSASNETQRILNDLLSRCTDNPALKTALLEYSELCSDSMSREALIGIMIGTTGFKELAKATASGIWSTVVANCNLVGLSITVGQKVGKFLSDQLFGTSDLIASYYQCCAMDNFEELIHEQVLEYERNFTSNPSIDNARVFNAAVQLLTKTYAQGFDALDAYMEASVEGGMLSGLFSTMSHERYLHYRETANTLRSRLGSVWEQEAAVVHNSYLDMLREMGDENQAAISAVGIENVDIPLSDSDYNYFRSSIPTDDLCFSTRRIREDWRLERDVLLYGSLYLESGTIDLNGHTLTVLGDVRQTGGTMFINCGTLEIGGDYIIASTDTPYSNGEVEYGTSYGWLEMVTEADRVTIAKDFVMYSVNDHGGYLTNGIMEIGGNFYQKGNDAVYTKTTDNFNASDSHVVVFTGDATPHISFDSIDSGFANVRFEKQKAEFDTAVKGFPILQPLQIEGDLHVSGDMTLDADMTVGGSLYLEDYYYYRDCVYDLNGHTLTVLGDVRQTGGTMFINCGTLEVGGDYIIASTDTPYSNGEVEYGTSNGWLEMVTEADRVTIARDFIMYSVNGHEGYLTNGIMEIGGNICQYCYGWTSAYINFDCTGNHTVVLCGSAAQTCDFQSSSSHFQNLIIANSAGSIDFAQACGVAGTLSQPGGAAILHPENVTLQGEAAFETHYELDDAINAFVGNAAGVTPTWLDYENYIEAQTEPEEPYTILAISLSDESGTALSSFPQSSAFLVNIDVMKNVVRDEQDLIIVAVYGTEGKMLSLHYVRAKFVDHYTYSFGFLVPRQSETVGKVKAFILHDFSDMTPLAEAKELT